jgi:DNA-binding GntR family transcriptional regulator
VPSKSKSEKAHASLRERILSTTILPGEHIAEMDWAERLHVGRFAIREALKRLHGEGLVTRVRNKYRVSTMNAEEVHEITHLRAILEAGALRFLKNGIPAKILKEIRQAANDYAALVKKGYFAGAQEADLRFHRAIVASAGNRRLIRIYEVSNLPLLQATIGKNSVSLNDYALAVREHEEICGALEKGNFSRAASALEKHLKRGEKEVIGK